ncbi:mucin-2-like [Panonychus citri]|uniref:mucin-2-like n=1 Tax=Panonychus citri TaxID=50023 RepID=UPI002308333D|nr:mucin-2-like [Panonychus citri]
MVMLTDEALAELAKIENKIGDYICRLCCQKFENAFSLALHRCSKIVHVVHRCPECAKVFNCPANLASHRRWHKPRSSLGDLKETLGKEEGEIDDEDEDEDEGDFIEIEGEESTSGQTMVNSPISNGSISPLSQSFVQTNRSRPPPSSSPPPLKRTKTVCVTGTVKIDSQETSSINPIELSTINSQLPIPLISKCSIKFPSIRSPIKSPIRSPYKPSPLCSLSHQPPTPPLKLPRPSHGPSPTISTKYPLIRNSANILLNCEPTIGPTTTTESELPLALTSPTTPTSPTSPSVPVSSSSSSSSTSSSPPPQGPKTSTKSRPIMETIESSSSSSSSSSSPSPQPPPPSSTQQQMNTPTTPPPTPPPHQQQNQQQSSSSSTTIIGEMTTMTKDPLFGWTYYPKKFRRQAYMRIKHCCP